MTVNQQLSNRLQQLIDRKTVSSKSFNQTKILILLTVACLVILVNQVNAMGFSLDFDPPTSSVKSRSSPPAPIGNSVQRINFLDSNCQWPSGDGTPMEVIGLLLIFKCDVKPLLGMIKQMLSHYSGAIRPSSLEDLEKLNIENGLTKALRNKKPQSLIWNEYKNLDNLIEDFFSDSMFGLGRKDFCTYPTVERFARLKQHLSGSKFLNYIYDIITIEYHKSCLAEAISKLPQVPYLVREVVDIYISGADQAVPDLNGRTQLFDEQMEGYDSQFNLQEALERNGRLKDVVKLSLSIPSGVNQVDTFKAKCREFLIEIEERWQSMEMMSRMLSTEGNGIQSFNNYVMRRLTPTKFADICSQLSTSDN